MRKHLQLVSLTMILISILCGFVIYQNRMVYLEVGGGGEIGFYVSVKTDTREENIYPWYNESENLYYLFLPSCVKSQRIYFRDNSEYTFDINGLMMESGEFNWDLGEVNEIRINNRLYRTVIMKSESIPSFFMETESGSMKYLNEDKDNEESGKLTIVAEDGHVQFSGRLEQISGRGNVTWNSSQKPYSIRLSEAYPLCGLEAGEKWNLVSLICERDKIHTKILYDFAREMGLANTSECTWVDLYCNGQYCGLYLLAEAVVTGEGRVEIEDLEKNNKALNKEIDWENIPISESDGRRFYDIVSDGTDTDGYLIEKNIENQIGDRDALFYTDLNKWIFTVKSPKHASRDQIDYIADYVQNIENRIRQGDESYKEYIDIDSFAEQFLVDIISINIDAAKCSAYFYMKDGILHSGPLWDYDKSMGVVYANYELPVEVLPNGMDEWYLSLYSDVDFRSEMINIYEKNLSYLNMVLNEKIDEYAEKVRASAMMNSILTRHDVTANDTMCFDKYDNYIKYLKYYLAERLNYLNVLWDLSDYRFEVPESTEEFHRVVLTTEEGTVIAERYIQDGRCIEELPEYDAGIYAGWYFYSITDDYYGKAYEQQIPIYEDVELRMRLHY